MDDFGDSALIITTRIDIDCSHRNLVLYRHGSANSNSVIIALYNAPYVTTCIAWLTVNSTHVTQSQWDDKFVQS